MNKQNNICNKTKFMTFVFQKKKNYDNKIEKLIFIGFSMKFVYRKLVEFFNFNWGMHWIWKKIVGVLTWEVWILIRWNRDFLNYQSQNFNRNPLQFTVLLMYLMNNYKILVFARVYWKNYFMWKLFLVIFMIISKNLNKFYAGRGKKLYFVEAFDFKICSLGNEKRRLKNSIVTSLESSKERLEMHKLKLKTSAIFRFFW